MLIDSGNILAYLKRAHLFEVNHPPPTLRGKATEAAVGGRVNKGTTAVRPAHKGRVLSCDTPQLRLRTF